MGIISDLSCFYDRLAVSGLPGADFPGEWSRETRFDYEVTITKTGDFAGARVLSKKDGEQYAVNPVTPESEVRTSNVAPMPFGENMKYLSADAGRFVKNGRGAECREKYTRLMKDWDRFAGGNDKIRAVLAYLEKDTILKDLCALDSADGGPQKDKDSMENRTGKAMVRFVIKGCAPERPWEDRELLSSWDMFMSERTAGKECALDCVTGEYGILPKSAPAKIVNEKPNAKLIAPMIKEKYVLGMCGERFTDPGAHALKAARRTTLKAWRALRWLAQKDSVRIGDTYWFAFMPDTEAVPMRPLLAYIILSYGTGEGSGTAWDVSDVLPCAGRDERVVAAAIEPVSDGKLAVVYCLDTDLGSLSENIRTWEEKYGTTFGDGRKVYPSTFHMVCDAFGTKKETPDGLPILRAGSTAEKWNMNRLIRAMLEGRDVTDDIVHAAVMNASRTAYIAPKDDHDPHGNVCRTADALMRQKAKRKGTLVMDNDTASQSRSYLYGRVLAVYDRIEEYALWREAKLRGKKHVRLTDAKRLWNAYVISPAKTAALLHENIIRRYWSGLPAGAAGYYQKTLEDLYTGIESRKENGSGRLEDDYICGYMAQMRLMKTSRNVLPEQKTEED